MSIKQGDVISHSEATQWGVGKVLEVTSSRVTIQFNDGITRKIASSHWMNLLPAERSAFLPTLPEEVQKVATKPAPKARKNAKKVPDL